VTTNSNFGSISTDHLIWIGHEKWDDHAHQGEHKEADLDKNKTVVSVQQWEAMK
jgi:hypothetical protein